MTTLNELALSTFALATNKTGLTKGIAPTKVHQQLSDGSLTVEFKNGHYYINDSECGTPDTHFFRDLMNVADGTILLSDLSDMTKMGAVTPKQLTWGINGGVVVDTETKVLAGHVVSCLEHLKNIISEGVYNVDMANAEIVLNLFNTLGLITEDNNNAGLRHIEEYRVEQIKFVSLEKKAYYTDPCFTGGNKVYRMIHNKNANSASAKELFESNGFKILQYMQLNEYAGFTITSDLEYAYGVTFTDLV